MSEIQQPDRVILDWIAAHTNDPALRAQIEAARARKRDFTRTGIFLYFERDASLPAVPRGIRPVCPAIEAPGLMDGAGCDLFLRDGYLHYLEIYARGGFLPEPFEEVELRPAD